MPKLTSSNGLVTFTVPSTKPKAKPKNGTPGPKGLSNMFKGI